MGVFRSLNNPRVIWLGIEPMPVLQGLKEKIDKDLRSAGFEIERREFKPHLTLGRIKSLENRSGLDKLIRENQGRIFMSGKIKELVLFESKLKPEGPEYIPLKRSGFRCDGP
jgi:2'-5' RNA ligase